MVANKNVEKPFVLIAKKVTASNKSIRRLYRFLENGKEFDDFEVTHVAGAYVLLMVLTHHRNRGRSGSPTIRFIKKQQHSILLTSRLDILLARGHTSD